jgi:hypothetical protein
MDNSAKILNVLVSNGVIQPCIRVNRAIYVASTEAPAAFDLEMSFSYLSRGNPVVVPHRERVSATAFVDNLDTRWVQVRGTAVRVTQPPDRPGTMTCTVIVTIKDRTGTRIEQCNAEVTAINV